MSLSEDRLTVLDGFVRDGMGAAFGRDDLQVLIAELRASRKVVEAAQAVFDGIYNEAIGSDEIFSREMALKDALAELSSINAKESSA